MITASGTVSQHVAVFVKIVTSVLDFLKGKAKMSLASIEIFPFFLEAKPYISFCVINGKSVQRYCHL